MAPAPRSGKCAEAGAAARKMQVVKKHNTCPLPGSTHTQSLPHSLKETRITMTGELQEIQGRARPPPAPLTCRGLPVDITPGGRPGARRAGLRAR